MNKKLITLAILAGLLTTALTSCFSKIDTRPNDTSTNDVITVDGTSDNDTPINVGSPGTKEYVAESTTVYVKTATAKLYEVEDTEKTETVKRFDEENKNKLTRIAKSTDNAWSKVTFNDKTYYVLTSSLTTADMLAEHFTVLTSEQTMYVSNTDGGVNIRQYPTAESNELSKPLKSLPVGTAIKVLATGTGWYKIRYENGSESVTGFMNADYLRAERPVTAETDFTSYFTKVTETVKYVSVDLATVRKIPSTSNDIKGSWVAAIKKGEAVTVVAEGVVSDQKWYGIKWAEAVEVGMPQTYTTCYINVSCVSTGATSSLADYLSNYPSLKEYRKVLYVAADSLNGRSTPDTKTTASDKDNNIVKSLKKKDQVNVVAVGSIDGGTWALVQDSTSSFYFVNFSYLTTDSEGKRVAVPMDLPQILAIYSNFTAYSATGTAKAEIKALNVPDTVNGSVMQTLSVNASLKIVAKGYVTSGFVDNYWYVIEDATGNCYFVGQGQVDIVS